MDRNEASALADLQMHWDEAYAIGFDGDVWSARFHGSTDELCARTSSDLRELIRADYVHRQRPRRPAPPTGTAEASDGQAGDGQASDGPASDRQASEDDGHAADGAASAPGGVDFASIRGERMST